MTTKATKDLKKGDVLDRGTLWTVSGISPTEKPETTIVSFTYESSASLAWKTDETVEVLDPQDSIEIKDRDLTRAELLDLAVELDDLWNSYVIASLRGGGFGDTRRRRLFDLSAKLRDEKELADL